MIMSCGHCSYTGLDFVELPLHREPVICWWAATGSSLDICSRTDPICETDLRKSAPVTAAADAVDCRCHGDMEIDWWVKKGVIYRAYVSRTWICTMLLPGLLMLIVLTKSQVVTQNHRMYWLTSVSQKATRYSNLQMPSLEVPPTALWPLTLT